MNKSKPFSLNNMMGFYVNRAAFLMSEGIAQRFAELGYAISAQDFGILVFLWKKDGVKHSEIAEHMLRDKTTITRRIDALVKKGILTRKTDDLDRRISRVYLTKLGQDIQSVLIQAVLDYHLESLVGISSNDIEITLKTLNKIIHNQKGKLL